MLVYRSVKIVSYHSPQHKALMAREDRDFSNIPLFKHDHFHISIGALAPTPPKQEKSPELEILIINIICNIFTMIILLNHIISIHIYHIFINLWVESANLKIHFFSFSSTKVGHENNTRLPYHHHLQKAQEPSCYPSSCCLGSYNPLSWNQKKRWPMPSSQDSLVYSLISNRPQYFDIQSIIDMNIIKYCYPCVSFTYIISKIYLISKSFGVLWWNINHKCS